MRVRATYSFACAAFATLVAVAGLGGCFSEHVAVAPPTGEELCSGAQPVNVVRIVDFGFSPSQLNVPRGTTVTFVNCSASSTQHSTTSDQPGWNSGLLSRFATFQRTFDTAGTFPYHCTPHPFMQGTVVAQ
jgi:plastocyanin